MGSGIGNLDDAYDTAVSFENGVRSSRCCVEISADQKFRATERCHRSLFHVSSSISPLDMSQCVMVSRSASSLSLFGCEI